jgi:transcriptional regulator with XRE-family HTH domain
MTKSPRIGGRSPRPALNRYTHLENPNRSADAQRIYNEFGRRLQRAAVAKGWTQSELARRASAYLPKNEGMRGSAFERSAISGYMKGESLPLAPRLAALAKALDVKEEDLLPPEMLKGGAAPEPRPFAMEAAGENRVSFHLNRTMSMATAVKIVQLLAEEDKLE